MINIKKIAILILASVILVAGCVDEKSSETSKSTKPLETTIKETETPIPIVEENNIIIKYSDKLADSVGEFKPKFGNSYLIVTMNIENHGYEQFSTGPVLFSVISNNIKYDYKGVDTFDKLDYVDLLSGGYIKGSIVFEVPTDIKEYKLQYNSRTNYNIIYQKE